MGKDRQTVNPTLKRVYSYGQMAFGAITGICVTVGSVYAFLSKYPTEPQVQKLIHAHSVDVVATGEPLPHNNRFKKVERQLKALREAQASDQEIVVALKSTSLETMKVLVRRIVADLEARPSRRMEKGAIAEDIFEHWIEKGNPPIEALRKAVRACSRATCRIP